MKNEIILFHGELSENLVKQTGIFKIMLKYIM